MAIQSATRHVVLSQERVQAQKRKMRLYDASYLWLSRVIIWAVILLTVAPVVSVVVASFSPGGAFTNPRFFPEHWTLGNYAKLFAKRSDFLIWVKNTFILGTATGVLTSFLTVLAAYAVSRMRFRGRKYGLMSLLVIQMFPAFMALPAIFQSLRVIGGLDTLWGLVLVYSGTGAFNIWLMKNYIDNIPRELDEAAMVDGATPFQIFSRIIIPLAKPMIMVQFLWSFMGPINDYIVAKVVIHNKLNYTLPLGLKGYSDQFSTRWGEFSAAVLLACIPVMLVWFINQKWVQQGLTAGAVKG